MTQQEIQAEIEIHKEAQQKMLERVTQKELQVGDIRSEIYNFHKAIDNEQKIIDELEKQLNERCS
jgi:hypothetical protein